MPNSAASDIADIIVSGGVGSYDWEDDSLPLVVVGAEPVFENRAIITLYDTGGPASNPAYQRDFPRIQVRTKASSPFNYPSAYNPQQQIKDLILGMSRQVINNTLYVSVMQAGDITSLTSDNNNRSILVSNYKLIREYESLRKKIE